MHPLSARLLAGAAGGWLLLATAAIHAKTLKYPDVVYPELRLELPDDWKASQQNDSFRNLECTSSGGGAPSVTFMDVPTVDLDRDFAKAAGRIMHLGKRGKSAKLVAIGNDTLSDYLSVEFVRYTDEVNGDALFVTLYRVLTDTDRTVIVTVAELMDEPDSDQGIVRMLLASIRLIRN